MWWFNLNKFHNNNTKKSTSTCYFYLKKISEIASMKKTTKLNKTKRLKRTLAWIAARTIDSKGITASQQISIPQTASDTELERNFFQYFRLKLRSFNQFIGFDEKTINFENEQPWQRKTKNMRPNEIKRKIIHKRDVGYWLAN